MLYVFLILIILLLILILAQQMGIQDDESVLDDPFPKMRHWFVVLAIGMVIVGAILYWVLRYFNLI